MHQAGIPIICGTDAGIGVTLPGFSIHQELAFYQEAGMTNFEALKTATINAAQTHQKMNHLGTVAIGKTANLILVRENPLEQLRVLKKPEMVIVKGAVYKQQELQKFIKRAKNRSNTIATFIRYVENWIVEK
jgi:imidazolonepropionase-like amidohydrolase